jgi:TonB family protein
MRLRIFCFVGLLLSVDLALAQTPKPGSPSPSPLPTLPELRPALIGTAPNSLINTIDTADLIKKGQKEAAVMFSCLVAPTGQVVTSGAYRGTRGSELLEQELLKRLATARFIPAVHNHQPVIAVFYGTVKFAVVNGKPRLRIFANQELNEVDKESDFIDPQPYVEPPPDTNMTTQEHADDSKFTGLHYPETGSTVAVTGVVELALNVDAKGNLTNLQVLSEQPPLLGFGDAALSDFSGAKFIPAFRNGQPVESNVKIPVYYKPSAAPAQSE